MAGLIPAGSVVDPREDVFPTTGAHLDVRVIPQFGSQKGKKINPRNARSILQNLLIGADKRPLVQQDGKDWRWNFPVTSEYGARTSPTAGASTFHQGIDIGVGVGTPITYKGYGTYRPDSGYGSVMTTDAQGNPYEIRLLHTKPGKSAAVGSSAAPAAPVLPESKESIAEKDQKAFNILAQIFGQQKEEKPQNLTDVLMQSALNQAMQRKSLLMGSGAEESNPYSGYVLNPSMLNLFS